MSETADLVAARLQNACEGDLANAVRTGSTDCLSERRKADLDAYLYGRGYLLDGKRIDPRNIQVVFPAKDLH